MWHKLQIAIVLLYRNLLTNEKQNYYFLTRLVLEDDNLIKILYILLFLAIDPPI